VRLQVQSQCLGNCRPPACRPKESGTQTTHPHLRRHLWHTCSFILCSHVLFRCFCWFLPSGLPLSVGCSFWCLHGLPGCSFVFCCFFVVLGAVPFWSLVCVGLGPFLLGFALPVFLFFVAAPGRSLACWVVSVAVACRHFVFVVFSLSFLFASLLFSLGCPWWTLLCAHRQFGGTFSAHTVDAQCTLDCACPHAW
jgi:hypothetical protein